jgi:heterodisulfide reductase subunit A-like polyferredoxin
MGMEGNGPNAGDPRFIGLLLGSTNPLALDIVASEIIGMQRLHNPLLIEAENRNLSPRRIEQTEIIGEKLIDCRIRDFKIPGSIQSDMAFGSMNWLTPLVRNVMTVQPVVDREKCIACGVCRDACPMEVISVMDKEYAQIDNKKCIRCYCCHEMCPNDAIALKSTLIYRFLKRVIPDGR